MITQPNKIMEIFPYHQSNISRKEKHNGKLYNKPFINKITESSYKTTKNNAIGEDTIYPQIIKNVINRNN